MPLNLRAVRRSLWLALTILGTTTLTGCDQSESVAYGYCPVPIKADACTKAWLAAQKPPQCVHHWVKLIADQQQAIGETCQ